jgi:hypothetical protein
MALFQNHHIISQSLAETDDILLELQNFTGGSQFNVDAAENLTLLPATRDLAKALGQAVGAQYGSISPHNGAPLGSYEVTVHTRPSGRSGCSCRHEAGVGVG